MTRGAIRITLTSKEFTLLEFFLRHQGEVLPRSLIASQVWDMNFDSDTNADVAVGGCAPKLITTSSRSLSTVRSVGYMLGAGWPLSAPLSCMQLTFFISLPPSLLSCLHRIAIHSVKAHFEERDVHDLDSSAPPRRSSTTLTTRQRGWRS